MRYNECDRAYEDQVLAYIKRAIKKMCAYHAHLDLPLIEVTEIKPCGS